MVAIDQCWLVLLFASDITRSDIGVFLVFIRHVGMEKKIEMVQSKKGPFCIRDAPTINPVYYSLFARYSTQPACQSRRNNLRTDRCRIHTLEVLENKSTCRQDSVTKVRVSRQKQTQQLDDQEADDQTCINKLSWPRWELEKTQQLGSCFMAVRRISASPLIRETGLTSSVVHLTETRNRSEWVPREMGNISLIAF